MRLLFITQKVDKDDDVLGVYHEWIAGLAKKLEKVSVICLYRGRTELPVNVSVYSLGKESGPSRWKYLWRFYKYIWSLRREYDTVFVHMNPEYVILGWKLWRLLGKKIMLWYNHPLGGFRARLAINLADKVFCTSPFAFAFKYGLKRTGTDYTDMKESPSKSAMSPLKSAKYVLSNKVELMPVGIDMERFRNLPSLRATAKQSYKNSILYIGRISPIKKIETLITAAEILAAQNIDFRLTIAGAPSKPSEEKYAEEIKNKAEPLVKKGIIKFIRSIPNYKTPELYSAHDLSVNMTLTGSFDKAIVESMACETPVIVSNKSVGDILPSELIFEEGDADDLAKKIGVFLNLSVERKSDIGKKIRQVVIEKHSLNKLIDHLVVALIS